MKVQTTFFIIVFNVIIFMGASSPEDLIINSYFYLMQTIGDYDLYQQIKTKLGDDVAIKVCSYEYPTFICEKIIKTMMSNESTHLPPTSSSEKSHGENKLNINQQKQNCEILESLLYKKRGISQKPIDFLRIADEIKIAFPNIFGSS